MRKMIETWNGSLYLSPSSSSSSIAAHSPLPSPTPSSSKTHAFFSSPFQYPAPLPPPALHSRSVSSRTDSSSDSTSSAGSSTGSASSDEASPSSDGRQDHHHHHHHHHQLPQDEDTHAQVRADNAVPEEAAPASDGTPKLEHHFPSPSPATHRSPAPALMKSLNAEFFRPSILPTPPPSIRSFSAASSRDPSPHRPAPTLPPLERFFPSRRAAGGGWRDTWGEGSTGERSREPSADADRERRGFQLLDDDKGREPEDRSADWGRHPTAPPPALSALLAETKWTTTAERDLYAHAPAGEGQHVGYVTKTQMTASPTDDLFPPVAPPPPPEPSQPESKPDANADLVPGLVLHPLPSSDLPIAITFTEHMDVDAAEEEKDSTLAHPSLTLLRPLGQGAFSSVWLAHDARGIEMEGEAKRRRSLLRKGRGRGKKGSAEDREGRGERKREVAGLRPVGGWVSAGEEGGKEERPTAGKGKGRSRLVAVKMTERAACERDMRTRVSVVREVEVLRHISHPSIISYLHAFSTPTHHCLVLEYVAGGELFELVAAQHRLIRTRVARILAQESAEPQSMEEETDEEVQLTEEVVRRIFGELCKAVGWMHGVGLVHRDIKLENILLTTPLPPPPLPAPFIKLTDFGLSRFLPPPSSSQLLTTLCGSESYAAPELVCGGPYDGRKTDAWACGVVLYAMVTGGLPFERGREGAGAAPLVHEGGGEREGRGERERARRERKALLVRIASAEYAWPPPLLPEGQGLGLDLATEGAKRVVGRLLVREPALRAGMEELWEEEWMRGPGAPAGPASEGGAVSFGAEDEVMGEQERGLGDVGQAESGEGEEVESGERGEGEGECGGTLVDGQEIGPESVARQEH